jgi:hypothetical protein
VVPHPRRRCTRGGVVPVGFSAIILEEGHALDSDMHLVFCSDPLTPRQPDSAYGAEVAAATAVGADYVLVDYEALTDERDPARAVRRVPQQAATTPALYRGWMLTPPQYSDLYDALVERGVSLLNDPAAYRYCHYLPEWYPALAAYTPATVWCEYDGHLDMAQVMALLAPFGTAPLIVKDYVKSRKHEWYEACYIPSAADAVAVERVVRRFIELQAEGLNEGLVFREFVEFEPLGSHSKSGMPLTREYRLFFLDGQPLYATEYWDESEYAGSEPPLDEFTAIAGAVPNRFFTMDVARVVDGRWMIVELGDGQVAGLPSEAHAPAYYRVLAARWARQV